MNVANVKEALNLNDANKAITPHTLGLVLKNFNTCPYRIGDILLSVTDEDPAIRFGGKWERLKDRFLLGAGSSYKAGKTGGASTVSLSVANLPSHNHSFSGNTGGAGEHHHTATTKEMSVKISGSGTWTGVRPNGYAGDTTVNVGNKIGNHTHSFSGTTGNTGSGTAHNNMPPYLVVYMWKRVA